MLSLSEIVCGSRCVDPVRRLRLLGGDASCEPLLCWFCCCVVCIGDWCRPGRGKVVPLDEACRPEFRKGQGPGQLRSATHGGSPHNATLNRLGLRACTDITGWHDVDVIVLPDRLTVNPDDRTRKPSLWMRCTTSSVSGCVCRLMARHTQGKARGLCA